ncbi:unnamed protein product [Paramecium pentaurelia]|uniref:Cyclin-like domain-containing protein n=1 Tax=Paramecium pentaurelia TaxID=43138 RepID=A0A8S1TZL8_9CILI|nr:unnamed protein product [Paramecium pentaurelia]
MQDNIGTRVFGKNLENQADKASKNLKSKKDTTLDELGGKENIINDAIWTKEGLNKLDSPQLVNLYQQEIYEFLYEKEKSMGEPNFQMSSTKINDTMRATTVRYIVKLIRCFNLKPETLFQTVDLMDQTIPLLNPEIGELELVSLTCLFIASKYEEIYPPPLAALLRATDIKAKDVIEMEKEILNKLNFNVISDNTLVWLQLIGEILGYNCKYTEQIKQRCMSLAETSLTSSLFLNHKKSVIALNIFMAVEMNLGSQKTQFKWERLTQHQKPSNESKTLKLLTYILKIK